MSCDEPIAISDVYTGDTTNSRTAQRKTAGHAEIIKMSVGPMDNNTYLLTDLASRQSMLIDAANDADRILSLIKQEVSDRDRELALIVTTHRHPDHWQALEEVAEATGAPTAAGEFDCEGIPHPIDEQLTEGNSLALGSLVIEIIHLKGHTPGSIALVTSPDGHTQIFSGDSLFPGGLGKTNTPRDFCTLIADVETQIFDRYLDDACVLPGHGKDTTLGNERAQLPQWKERGW